MLDELGERLFVPARGKIRRRENMREGNKYKEKGKLCTLRGKVA